MAETRHTLQTLLTAHEVHIPLLQRDYAQGRKNKGDIRRTFVEQLRTTLATEGQQLNLDFIYGYLQNRVYYPLDGQQRLTTLWLLYWYLAPPEQCAEAQVWLKGFGYRTRITAERFCRLLVEHIKELRVSGVKQQILHHSPWFRSSWQDEPTVAAMLEMLEELERQLGGLDHSRLWERLTAAPEQAAITFDSIDIHAEDFHLTDELYIKMNARGKALTRWECYKAQLTDVLSRVEASYSYEGQELSCVGYFAQKVDGAWLDLFWSPGSPDIAGAEERMLGFFHTLARLCFFRRPYTRQGNVDDRPIADFKEADRYEIFAEPEHASLLIDTLDLLYKLHQGGGVREFFVSLSEGLALFAQDNLFYEACKDSPDVRSQILLLFVLEYMRRHRVRTCDEGLKDFARVMRNQLERTRTLRSTLYETDVRINRLNDYWAKWSKLMEHREVYRLLSEQPEDYLNKHEHQKAQLIMSAPELKPSLQRAEEHPLLRGLIGVLQTEGWEQTLERKTRALYDIWGIQDDALINQALITCGYKGVYIRDVDHYSREAWLMGKGELWATILTFDRATGAEAKQAVRELLDRYAQRQEDGAKEKLRAIVDEYRSSLTPSDWRYYFCKYPAMLSEGKSYYAWAGESSFDVRQLGTYGSNPLIAYHSNPYALAVCAGTEAAGVRRSQGSDKVALELPHGMLLSPGDEGWYIIGGAAVLSQAGFQEIFERFGITEDELMLRDTAEQDRVEVAVAFCEAIQALAPQVAHSDPEPSQG